MLVGACVHARKQLMHTQGLTLSLLPGCIAGDWQAMMVGGPHRLRGGSLELGDGLVPRSASEPQQRQHLYQPGALGLKGGVAKPLLVEQMHARSISDVSDLSSSKHTLPAVPNLEGQQPPAAQAAAASPQQQLTSLAAFPVRQGQPPCEFYVKTGHCKFGENCRFDHPPQYAVRLNSVGLPLRPGEPACAHFEKTRLCKFGPACKFDHPELHAPVPA